jgi:hypothetical protein
MFKANINNQIVTVKIIDTNYNNHAKEVIIMEGIHKGRYAIVENNDIIIDSYKQLVELCKQDIENIEDLNEHYFTELISQSTHDIIKEFSKRYTLTNGEYYKLLNHFHYEHCKSIEEVKEIILTDSIEKSINNIKSSFTSVKNKALKEV